MKKLTAFALLFLCLPAFAQDKQMPDTQLPAITYFSQINGNKPESLVIGEIQFMLYRLGYYPSFPDGKNTPLYQEAVKKFQAANNAPQTGNLTVAEWQRLVNHYNYHANNIPLKQIYPTSYQFVQQGNLVAMKGTWRFTDSTLQMIAPIQVSDIRCDKTKNVCAEARSLLVNFVNEDLLAADLIAWQVTTWDNNEIIAENNSSDCVSYTLYINLQKQMASQTRRGKNCFGVASEPMSLELVDGKEVADEYYHSQDVRPQTNLAPTPPMTPLKL